MAIVEPLGDLYRILTSKAAQRTFINVGLLIGASISLFGLAGFASWLFYHEYLPDQVVTLPLYLQYGSGAHPYATAALPDRALKDRQEYDVSVTLSLPRSQVNLEQGNFMVAMYFMSPGGSSQGQAAAYSTPEPYAHFDGKSVLFTSRRPALVPYRDPVITLASKIIFLLYHLLFPSSQACALVVPMAERIEFRAASTMPASIYVEVQAGQTLEVYRAWITMTAQLRGLRWLMVNHRLLSFTALTSLFWLCEVSFMCMGWVLWSNLSRSKGQVERGDVIKREKGQLVGLGGTRHGEKLSLTHDARVKEETDDSVTLHDMTPAGTEADDEEDEEVPGRSGWREDTGVGTSFGSESGSGSLRRRPSQPR